MENLLEKNCIEYKLLTQQFYFSIIEYFLHSIIILTLENRPGHIYTDQYFSDLIYLQDNILRKNNTQTTLYDQIQWEEIKKESGKLNMKIESFFLENVYGIANMIFLKSDIQ